MWEQSAYAATFANVAFEAAPEFITAIFVQVAWGTSPTPPDYARLAEAEEHGFSLHAWAWCEGDDPEAEALVHSQMAAGYDSFTANMEEPYDAHGNSSDPRYEMPRRYLQALLWNGPLGLTTTPRFGSDMSAWRERGAIFQPQAFPRENGCDIDAVCAHAIAWGWPQHLVRPLVQAYPDPQGVRPDPDQLNAQATANGIGVIPYNLEQAQDEAGQQWLERMRPSIVRPNAPEPIPEEIMELIGSQHGITAMCENWRTVWPQWTNQSRTDPSTYKGIDKLERTLLILAADHDEIVLHQQQLAEAATATMEGRAMSEAVPEEAPPEEPQAPAEEEAPAEEAPAEEDDEPGA